MTHSRNKVTFRANLMKFMAHIAIAIVSNLLLIVNSITIHSLLTWATCGFMNAAPFMSKESGTGRQSQLQ